MWIRVVRVQRQISETSVAVPFEDVVRRDSSLESGSRRVVQTGAEGLELHRTLTVLEDGRVVQRQLVSVKTLRQPQNRIVRVGTAEPSFSGTGHSQDGLASWYRSDGLTAAHPSLPIGTIVRVTNTSNGRSVNVRIVDRGPYVDGRVIDLSDEAFSRLASLGEGTIHVHVSS
jgi:rare lipoprotein A (peptidoglycan hydrolase)